MQSLSVLTRIRRAARAITPPLLWNLARQLIFGPQAPPPSPLPSYQGVVTPHAMRALHEGRFAEIYDRWRILNPHNPPNETRLRQYLACLFAWQARGVPGDFIAAGVSFGVAPHVIYDFVGFSGLLKTYHFVDPFTGVMAGGSVNPAYNVDFELVRRQYPADAPIRFHRAMMPGCFPLEGVSAIAFAHLNVTDPPAEAASLAYLYERLAPGGAIVIDDYALNAGQFDVYDSAIERSGATIFTMVTGQGVIVKPIEST